MPILIVADEPLIAPEAQSPREEDTLAIASLAIGFLTLCVFMLSVGTFLDWTRRVGRSAQAGR